MINETINNLSSINFDIGNSAITWNNLYVHWIFSWTTDILFALVVGLIVWNIWLTYKLKRRKDK